MGVKLRICLAVFAMLATVVEVQADCSTPLNLMFLLDQSESIHPQDFQKANDFVSSMVNHFEIGESATLVSLVYYSDKAYDMFCFHGYKTKAALIEQLKHVNCEGCHKGYTMTGKAIHNVHTELMKPSCGARHNAKNVVIVITDGKATDHQLLAVEAPKLHALKNGKGETTVIAIGIGSYDISELKLIASQPSLVFTTKQYSDLSKMLVPINAAACTGRGKPTIKGQIDLLFVVDYSGSVQNPQFEQGKQFLRDLVGYLDIGPSSVQVSLILYGKGVKEMWTFNKYTTQASLDYALGHLACAHCDRHRTDTAEALKYARESSYTERCGARADSKKIVIVLTDGHATDNIAVLTEEATALKDSVDVVIAIGVGSYDKRELVLIASDIHLVFFCVTFDRLRTIETSLITQFGIWIKKAKQKCNEKIDLLLVVDRSGSISDTELAKVKSFLQELVDEFEIGPSKTQVSVVMFASVPIRKFCFNEHMSVHTMKDALKDLKCDDCKDWQTKTSKALTYAATKSFTSACGARTGAKRLTLVFTDGKASEHLDVVKAAADKLKKISPVITIGVGEAVKNQLGHDELKAIASSTKDVFEAVSFGTLPFIEKRVAARACRVAKPAGAVQPKGQGLLAGSMSHIAKIGHHVVSRVAKTAGAALYHNVFLRRTGPDGVQHITMERRLIKHGGR